MKPEELLKRESEKAAASGVAVLPLSRSEELDKLMEDMRDLPAAGGEVAHYEYIEHPAHYNQIGIECIDVIEGLGLNFNVGNAMKYIWRYGSKPGEEGIRDLKKAVFYLQREIDRAEVGKEQRRDFSATTGSTVVMASSANIAYQMPQEKFANPPLWYYLDDRT